jgi:hypothetical protein
MKYSCTSNYGGSSGLLLLRKENLRIALIKSGVCRAETRWARSVLVGRYGGCCLGTTIGTRECCTQHSTANQNGLVEDKILPYTRTMLGILNRWTRLPIISKRTSIPPPLSYYCNYYFCCHYYYFIII